MDILWTPSNPTFDRVEVPVLTCDGVTYKYDYKGFSDYPARCGWQKEKMLKGDFGGRKADDIASFLQSWLYFGMVTEILTKSDGTHLLLDVEQKLTTKLSDGSHIINSDALLEAAQQYVHECRIYSSEESGLIRVEGPAKQALAQQKQYAMRRIDIILDEVSGYMLCLTDKQVERSGVRIIPEAVALSIAVLGDLLTAMRNVIYVWGIAYQGQQPSCAEPGERPLQGWEQLMGFGMPRQIASDGTEHMRSWGDFPLIPRRMLEQGWCPSDLAHLEESAYTATTVYTTNLKRYREDLKHLGCSRTQCRAYDVGAAYVHGHTVSCGTDSSCALLCLPPNKTNTVVEEYGIPVLTFEAGDHARVHVQSHTEVKEDGFIAISHVWSDGLGNPRETALYGCQLDRIQKLVNDVQLPKRSTNTAFWLDTLCIPLGPPEVRRQAIERMATVYAEASHVLVLDAELEQVQHDCPFHEVLLRIALSGWNRRLWTLQEGVLSKELSFQLKGKARSLASLFEEAIAVQVRPDHHKSLFGFRPILSDCINLNLRHSSIARFRGSQRLGALSQALQRRSCMMPADEAICIATMLRLDLKKVLDVDASHKDERMAYIWLSQSEIPRSIFKIREAKLDEQGLPWAPRSLMGCEKTVHDSRLRCSQQDGKLVFQCAAFLFRKADIVLGFPVFMVPSTFQKDGIMVAAFLSDRQKPLLEAVNHPAILIPEISSAPTTETGARIYRGLLVAADSLELSDGTISATFLLEIYLTLVEVSPELGGTVPRPEGVFDIDIVIQFQERQNSIHFGNAFGFTNTTNNTLVKDYVPQYSQYCTQRMVILLRFLTYFLLLKISPTHTDVEDNTIATACTSMMLKQPTLQECLACFATMKEVVVTVCASVFKQNISTFPEAVEYIIEHTHELEEATLLQRIMNFHLRGADLGMTSSGPSIPQDLVDRHYEVFDDMQLRRNIVDDIYEYALSTFPSAVADDGAAGADNQGTIGPDATAATISVDVASRQHWPKLLLTFVLQDLSSVPKLFPRLQKWRLSYTVQARTE